MKGGLGTRYRLSLSKRTGAHHTDGAPAQDTSKQGFTIVEVMIVLAVTGGLFLAAAIAISGRTNKTQFQQSINQITDVIRQNINEVSVGYYPNAGNIRCTSTGSTLTLTSGSVEQGTNSGCVFLGKAMQFSPSPAEDPEKYISYSIAGMQRDSTGDEITSLAAARPTVIFPSSSQANAPDAAQRSSLQYGLTVSKMYYGGNEANAIGAFALVSSLGSYNGGQLQSGSQQISLVPITGSTRNSSLTTMANTINSNLASSPVAPTGGVSICFDSGGTNESGLVTIGGGNSSQLSVTLTIKGNKGC